MSNNESDESPSISVAPLGDIRDVTVHPLVLLSAADHYHRVARGTRKRVVGVLLGSVNRGSVDATNSFAVPFEEDNKNPAVFYLDHNYLENMLGMFRKVNAKERIVGFYSTGPQIRPNDLRIHSMLTRFLPKGTYTPLIFCIIDVRPNRKSIPTTAYKMVQQVEENSKSSVSSSGQTQVQQSFAHVPSMIGAMEAEEVGVEHLLRDINDPTISTISSLIQGKMAALASLTDKLSEMKEYLELIVDGKVKPNQDIIANMQSILNLLPNLNIDELVRALLVKTNDMHMVVYLSSLIRSVIALHDLVNNKIRYNEQMDKNLELVSGKEDKKSQEETDAKRAKNSENVDTANIQGTTEKKKEGNK
mmetsp:Transcript_4570/g.8812  ORF Transcript_4570/g.8812 Transcript_4570/m.8812 type:complete len:361 (+) Transcript_4570:86-1168(+)